MEVGSTTFAVVIDALTSPSSIEDAYFTPAPGVSGFINVGSAVSVAGISAALKVSNYRQTSPVTAFMMLSGWTSVGVGFALVLLNNEWSGAPYSIAFANCVAPPLGYLSYLVAARNTDLSDIGVSYRGMINLASGTGPNIGDTTVYWYRNTHPTALHPDWTSAYDDSGIAYSMGFITNDLVSTHNLGNAIEFLDYVSVDASIITIHTDVAVTNTLTCLDETTASSSETGAFAVAGGVGIGDNLYVGADVHAGGAVTVTDATESVSTSTGSLVTAGGIGVAKAAFVGGAVNVMDATDSSSVLTGSIITAGGIGVAKAAFVGGAVNVIDATESVSVATGSLITAGGIGVAKAAFVGGAVNVMDATESVSVVTGSLITAGGIGVAKDVCIGGDILLKDDGALDHGLFADTELNVGTADGAIKFTKHTDIGGLNAAMKSNMPLEIYQQGWRNSFGPLKVYDDTSVKLGLSTAGELSVLTKITCEGDLHISSGVPATYALRTLNGFTDIKQLRVIDTTESTSVSTGSTVLAGGIGVAKAAFVGGAVNVMDATTSTSVSTGSLITAGGIGVAKAAFIGGAVNVMDTTESVSAVTGSLITAGGIGVAKNVFASGIVTGATVNGKVTAVNSEAGITTITASGNQHIYVQGGTTQTIKLPVLGTMNNGHTFHIHNEATGAVTVTDSDAVVIAKLLNGQRAEFMKLTTAWSISTRVPIAASTTMDVMTLAQSKIFNGLPPPTLIIKSGESVTVQNNTYQDIVFPTAFPTACTSVVVTGRRDGAIASSYGHMVSNVSATGFRIKSMNALDMPCYWIATGY